VREGREHRRDAHPQTDEARWHLARVPLTDDVGRVLGWFSTAPISTNASRLAEKCSRTSAPPPSPARPPRCLGHRHLPRARPRGLLVVDIRVDDGSTAGGATRTQRARICAALWTGRAASDNHPRRVMRTGRIMERAPESFGPRLGRDAAARGVLARQSPPTRAAAARAVISTLGLLTSGDGHEFDGRSGVGGGGGRRTALAFRTPA
jgi:hypothetical protein